MKRTAPKLFSLFTALMLALGMIGQIIQPVKADGTVSLTALDTAYTQDFNTLATSGTTNATSTLPTGWMLTETGGGGRDNEQYAAGTGSSNTGDTYSFGSATAPSDRAFGGLRSTNLEPVIGASFTNNTGATITSLAITYTGEMWRLGVAGQVDRMEFQISYDATSLNTGSWADVDNLDFITPNTTGTAGLRDGNNSDYRTIISHTLTSVSIANGSTFWIKWLDYNPSDSDNGLAVDDFSLTPSGTVVDTAPTVASTTPANGTGDVALNSNVTVTFSEPVDVTSGWARLECTISGNQAFSYSGGPTTFTIYPTATFSNSETCTLTVYATEVSDQDTNDPPNTMAINYTGTFTTESAAVAEPKINEFSASTTGTDVEFVEIFGDPNTDYSAYTVLEIEGDATGQGYIDEVIAVGTTDANGLFLASLAANSLENNTLTLLLVKDFTGALNSDLDTDNNGVFNTTPWSAITDSVAVHDGGASDLTYGAPTLAVGYDGLTFAPGGASRIPDGYDTEAATDWVRNDFDLAGIPGYTGTLIVGEALNTPGAPNATVPPDIAPTIVTTYPLDNATDVPMNASVTVTFSEPVDISGGVDITCTTTNPVLVGVTWNTDHSAITLDPVANFASLETCTVTVTASSVTDRDTPIDNLAADYIFDFQVMTDPCSLPYTRIHDIQGPGDNSPLTGTQVSTMGVVVGDFEGPFPALQGFYIQELDANQDADPLTSEGLFVYEDSTTDNVNLGDLVRVTGTVSDFQDQSEIHIATPVVCSSGNSVTPTAVSLPVPDATYYERYEGMLVTYAQPLYVTENYYLGRFGQVTVSGIDRLDQPTAVEDPGAPAMALDAANQLNKVIVDDELNNQNRDPIVLGRGGSPLSSSNTLRGGDTITGLTGVMTYTWSGNAASGNTWRVRPVTSMSSFYSFAATNPRPTATPAVGGSVKIAGMNLLNYYNTFTGCTYGVGGVAGDCRGAENLTEFDRQWPKTIAAIVALDADVLGVVELENDGYGTDSALQDLVNKLNAAAGAGTYAFINVDTNTGLVNAMGVDGIRNAILYQPANVTPVGTTAVLNSVTFVNGGDSAARNRVSLLQAFEDNVTGGTFLVNVNHLKSKGSVCDDPDALDGQGNCNIVRVNGVNALVSWFATDPTGTGDPDIVMLGDLNSYAKEDPIKALETAGFINSAHAFLGDAAYSYVYNEYVGGLDYAMVSPTFYAQTSGVEEWHINADEPVVLDYNTNYKTPAQLTSLYDTSFYRVSDHDPVVVGFTPDGSGPTAAVTDPLNGTILTEVIINELTVTYSEDVMHDGGEFAADNPINYMLVEQGFNNLFDTVTCDAGVQTDDVTIAINSIAYDPATYTAVLSVNGGAFLPEGDFRLFVCGTSSIRDLRGNILNGGLFDTYSDFGVRWPIDAASAASATALPATGFAPDRVTNLPAQTVKYAGLGDLWLEIPSLNVKTSIVGVPLTNGTWDVTWLGSQTGWLEGSAYPTALGNSVLTAHVWDAVNKPGAFYGLNKLGYGDRVIVHSYGKTYTYEVRRVMSVNPSRVDAMLKHQEDAWLTLVTCQGYDADTDEYAYRTLVRAVLVDVK